MLLKIINFLYVPNQFIQLHESLRKSWCFYLLLFSFIWCINGFGKVQHSWKRSQTESLGSAVKPNTQNKGLFCLYFIKKNCQVFLFFIITCKKLVKSELKIILSYKMYIGVQLFTKAPFIFPQKYCSSSFSTVSFHWDKLGTGPLLQNWYMALNQRESWSISKTFWERQLFSSHLPDSRNGGIQGMLEKTDLQTVIEVNLVNHWHNRISTSTTFGLLHSTLIGSSYERYMLHLSWYPHVHSHLITHTCSFFALQSMCSLTVLLSLSGWVLWNYGGQVLRI